MKQSLFRYHKYKKSFKNRIKDVAILSFRMKDLEWKIYLAKKVQLHIYTFDIYIHTYKKQFKINGSALMSRMTLKWLFTKILKK